MPAPSCPVNVIQLPYGPHPTVHVMRMGLVDALLSNKEAETLISQMRRVLRKSRRHIREIRSLLGVVEVVFRKNAPLRRLISQLRSLRVPERTSSETSESSRKGHRRPVRAMPPRTRICNPVRA